MNISQIIERKGTDVKVVAADSRLRNAMTVMHYESIGSVIILDRTAAKPFGIVSQDAILAALTKRGSAGLDAPVAEIMDEPLYCSPADSSDAVLANMTRIKQRHAVVVDDDGNIRGIVSIGDLVATHIQDLETESLVLRDMARSRMLAA
ncbi:CBS domain-containing protein [Sphingomonadaceae bacterium]|nr:CBS domain-containing protein [Sphingomonadaceae bacterium]